MVNRGIPQIRFHRPPFHDRRVHLTAQIRHAATCRPPCASCMATSAFRSRSSAPSDSSAHATPTLAATAISRPSSQSGSCNESRIRYDHCQRLRLVGLLFQQDYELVATEARDRVVASRRIAKPIADRHEYGVDCRMVAGVENGAADRNVQGGAPARSQSPRSASVDPRQSIRASRSAPVDPRQLRVISRMKSTAGESRDFCLRDGSSHVRGWNDGS